MRELREFPLELQAILRFFLVPVGSQKNSGRELSEKRRNWHQQKRVLTQRGEESQRYSDIFLHSSCAGFYSKNIVNCLSTKPWKETEWIIFETQAGKIATVLNTSLLLCSETHLKSRKHQILVAQRFLLFVNGRLST